MRLYEFTDDGGLQLLAVGPEWMEKLRRLPAIARGDGAERFRAPDPLDPENRSPEASALREDWVDLVVPDLHEVFDNQHCAVIEVLDKAQPSEFGQWMLLQQKLLQGDAATEKNEEGGEGECELVDLTIPPELVESWYGALNQGRLALHARYAESESDLDSADDASKSDAWKHARDHYLFYSRLQAPLMQLMQMGFEGKDFENDDQEDDEEFDDYPPF